MLKMRVVKSVGEKENAPRAAEIEGGNGQRGDEIEHENGQQGGQDCGRAWSKWC